MAFSDELLKNSLLTEEFILDDLNDLEGKTLSLSHLTWALRYMDAADATLYVYSLTPCTSCADDCFVATLL